MSSFRVLTKISPAQILTILKFSKNLQTLKSSPKCPKLKPCFYGVRFYSGVQNPCWNCGTKIASSKDFVIFCPICQSVQKLGDDSDYFEILGLPRMYDVDMQFLQQRFRHLQSLLHPDKFSMKSEKERNLSVEWSTAINKAYQTLKNPLKRGKHLLQLHGESTEWGTEATSPEFLANMMEKFEEVADAGDLPKLQKLLDANEARLRLYREKISKAFMQQDKKNIKKNLVEMKYFESLNQELKDKIEKMAEGNT